MKKALISSIFLSAALLMAGGKLADPTVELVPVVEIPAADCTKNTVYKDKGTDLMWQDEAYSIYAIL